MRPLLSLLPAPSGFRLRHLARGQILAAKLEARYHGHRTLAATFLERYSENGRLVRSEAGVAYFRRPGKMRWEYESPEKNLFLVDGKNCLVLRPRRSHRHPRSRQAKHRLAHPPRPPRRRNETVSRLRPRRTRLRRKARPPPATPSSIAPSAAKTPNRSSSPPLPPPKIHLPTIPPPTIIAPPNNPSISKSPPPPANSPASSSAKKAASKSNSNSPPGVSILPVADSFFRFDVPPGVAIVNAESAAQQALKVNILLIPQNVSRKEQPTLSPYSAY